MHLLDLSLLTEVGEEEEVQEEEVFQKEEEVGKEEELQEEKEEVVQEEEEIGKEKEGLSALSLVHSAIICTVILLILTPHRHTHAHRSNHCSTHRPISSPIPVLLDCIISTSTTFHCKLYHYSTHVLSRNCSSLLSSLSLTHPSKKTRSQDLSPTRAATSFVINRLNTASIPKHAVSLFHGHVMRATAQQHRSRTLMVTD